MQRNCERCGKRYTTESRTRKYCEAKCRRAAHSHRRIVDPDEASAGGRRIEAATLAELEDAGRVGTVAGQAALNLARLLDAGRDPGASVASMTRELRLTMAEATADAAREGSGLDALADELARRRRGQRGA